MYRTTRVLVLSTEERIVRYSDKEERVLVRFCLLTTREKHAAFFVEQRRP